MDVIRDDIILPTVPLVVLGTVGGTIAGFRHRDRMRAAGTGAASGAGMRKGAAVLVRAAGGGGGGGGTGVVMYALATALNVTILSVAFFGCRTGLMYGASRLKDEHGDKDKDKDTDRPRQNNPTTTTTTTVPERDKLVASACAGFSTGTVFDTIRRGIGRGALVVGVTYGTLACVTDYGVQSALAYRAHRISIRRRRDQQGGGAGTGAGGENLLARQTGSDIGQFESGGDDGGGDGIESSEGVWERVKRHSPFRVIPDDEYRAIMVERVRDLDSQITLVDDEIRSTKRDIEGAAGAARR